MTIQTAQQYCITSSLFHFLFCSASFKTKSTNVQDRKVHGDLEVKNRIRNDITMLDITRLARCTSLYISQSV